MQIINVALRDRIFLNAHDMKDLDVSPKLQKVRFYSTASKLIDQFIDNFHYEMKINMREELVLREKPELKGLESAGWEGIYSHGGMIYGSEDIYPSSLLVALMRCEDFNNYEKKRIFYTTYKILDYCAKALVKEITELLAVERLYIPRLDILPHLNAEPDICLEDLFQTGARRIAIYVTPDTKNALFLDEQIIELPFFKDIKKEVIDTHELERRKLSDLWSKNF